MKCPHCLDSIFSQQMNHHLGTSTSECATVLWAVCPSCCRFIVDLGFAPGGAAGGWNKTIRVYPKGAARPIASEVPDPYRQDFIEACLVRQDSAKASAALSRRCVQAVLRDKAETTKKDLFEQIEEVINSGKVPSHIVDDLHAVRNIGNFAAHPMKSTNTGEIIDVEPGEAEWNLDVLESLFDFYFVQPALSAKRKAELNKKLKEAGKPEIK